VIVGAANGVADLVQSRLTPAQVASWGPGYNLLENGTATAVARTFFTATGEHVRPPGLGGEDGFGGLVGLIALPGAIALLNSRRRSVKLGWLLIPAAMLTVIGIATSQTRLAIVGTVIAVLAFLALTVTSRRGLTALLITTVIGLVGYFVASAVVSGTANRYSSIAPSQILGTSVSARQGSLALIPNYIADYPLGAGLGSVGPAAGSTLGGTVSKDLNGETEITFLLVETGIPGLLVMLAFVIATIRAGLALSRVADQGLQRCLMALTAVLISLLAAWLIGPVTADSPTAPILWLIGGCLAYWYGELRAGRLRTRSRLLVSALSMR
jgi:O-antigen ligase